MSCLALRRDVAFQNTALPIQTSKEFIKVVWLSFVGQITNMQFDGRASLIDLALIFYLMITIAFINISLAISMIIFHRWCWVL